MRKHVQQRGVDIDSDANRRSVRPLAGLLEDRRCCRECSVGARPRGRFHQQLDCPLIETC
jgi:hypothetical protein